MAHIRTYENHLVKLVKCLPMDDAFFIMELSAKGLLPGDTGSKIKTESTQADKASYFLSHVIKPALEIDDPAEFDKLLSIMKTCGYAHVQKLAATIKSEVDKPDEKTSHTSDHHEQPTSKDCVPHTSLISVTSLNADFASLLISVYRILIDSPNQQVNLKKCKEYCLTYFSVSEKSSGLIINSKSIAEIKRCKNFDKLFEIVRKHTSWDEHSLLTHIAMECGSVEGEQEIIKFDEKVDLFKELQIISNTSKQKFSKDFMKFCVIINKPYKRVTIEEYKEIKAYIFSNLKTNPSVAVGSVTMRFHSLHIEWLVSVQAVSHMIKSAHQSKDIFIKDNFVFMQIGTEVLINDEDTLAQLLSSKQLLSLKQIPKIKLTGSNEETTDEGLLVMERIRLYGEMSLASTDVKIKPAAVADEFSYVTEQITRLLQSHDPKVIEQCEKIMASDHAHGIKFFSDDQIKQLRCYKDTPSLLQELSHLWSWSNHSMLKVLVEFCEEAMKLLDEFNCHLDPLQPISSYPVFEVIPTDATSQTTLNVKFANGMAKITLQDVFDMCSLVVNHCGVTQYCLQLIATQQAKEFVVIYWSIPKRIVNLISSTVLQHSSKFYNMGVLEVAIYPDINIITGNIALRKTNQQEIDETELKYNLLYEEKASLESQLDAMRKQSKENRKLVKKHGELKAENQHVHDVATPIDLAVTEDNEGNTIRPNELECLVDTEAKLKQETSKSKNHHEATEVDQGKVMEQERCLVTPTNKDDRVQHYGEDSQTERHISTEGSDKPNQLRRRSSMMDDQMELVFSNPAKPVNRRSGRSGIAAKKPVTIPKFFIERFNAWPKVKALCWKDRMVEPWQSKTYTEYKQLVYNVAKSFLKLGLQPNHAVGILGFNSVEWFASSLGAIFAGGLSTGIYTTNSPEACYYILENCKANIVVVENQKQLDKILQVRDKLPHLKAIVQYKGELSKDYPDTYSWSKFLEVGKDMDNSVIDDIIAKQQPNHCAMLVYTSGTTGSPKGVMLSHDNLTWVSSSLVDTVGKGKLEYGGRERAVTYLPLSHIAGTVADMYLPVSLGATIYFAQPDALKGTLVETMKEVQPTFFFGVPRVFEKMKEKMEEIGQTITGFKAKIASWGRGIGLRGNRAIQEGGSIPWGWTVANFLVFKKVKEALGFGQCRIIVVGAAPIHRETLEFFMAVDVPLLELYGMSESTGPQTVNVREFTRWRTGSCGKNISGVETKIDNPDEHGDGEILFRGRHVFMGYLGMEEKTKETIDDEGWLHSGDIGRLDKDGFLYITGRIKELIITAGGENVPPVYIEDCIKSEVPFLSNVMLIGDKRKYLTCLITLKCVVNPDTGEATDDLQPQAIKLLQQLGSNCTTISQVIESEDKAVFKAIQDGIDRYNTHHLISNAQKVQKWTLLDTDFTIPGGELGPTLKLKRPVVLKKYAETIEAFYSDA